MMKIDKILTDELRRSIEALERFVQECNKEKGHMYDAAEDEDRAYDEWRQKRDDDEREQRLEAALDACKQAGVSIEHLKVLAFETGGTAWALKNSLKG